MKKITDEMKRHLRDFFQRGVASSSLRLVDHALDSHSYIVLFCASQSDKNHDSRLGWLERLKFLFSGRFRGPFRCL